MTNFVLHPGLPKSATTTLQRALFSNHSEVHYLGKRSDTSAEKGCASEEVYGLLKSVLWQVGHFDAEESRQRYRELVIERANPRHTVVASWEALGDINPNRFATVLSRVEQMVGKPRVIFGIRNPLSRLPSRYLQQVQGNYVRGKREVFGDSPYLDIEQWLDGQLLISGREHFWTHYLSNIRTAVQVLGAGSVGILVFEQLRADPMDFYTAVSNFLRIDCEETRQLCEDAHLNTRVTPAEIAYLKKQNSTALRRKLWRLQTQQMRRLGLELATCSDRAAGKKYTVALPDHWAERVRSDTAEGHRWLQNTFAIDLAAHGYPL